MNVGQVLDVGDGVNVYCFSTMTTAVCCWLLAQQVAIQPMMEPANVKMTAKPLKMRIHKKQISMVVIQEQSSNSTGILSLTQSHFPLLMVHLVSMMAFRICHTRNASPPRTACTMLVMILMIQKTK